MGLKDGFELQQMDNKTVFNQLFMVYVTQVVEVKMIKKDGLLDDELVESKEENVRDKHDDKIFKRKMKHL
jgi:hypothetical protein